MGEESHDFRAPWVQEMSQEEWQKFLIHNHNDVSRSVAYGIIEKWLAENHSPGEIHVPFAEIGFGQCLDFKRCFWRLHCSGDIRYTGYEITEQFVRMARSQFPGNDFRVGGFHDLPSARYGITYSRHVLEHQSPDDGYRAFSDQLIATFRLAIICWFVPPGEEQFKWCPNDGLGGVGAYVNRYSKIRIDEIIKEHGFSSEVLFTQVGDGPHVNAIYVMRKGD